MLDDYRSAVGKAVSVIAVVSLASCGAELSASPDVPVAAIGNGEPLEMQSSWLPPKTPVIAWEPRGGRIVFWHTALLRDETLTSADEWVLLDDKQKPVRVPRGHFVKYLTEAGIEDDCPSEPSELAKCVVFVGSGKRALFANMAAGTACRIELKPRPAPLAPEEERRKEVGDLISSAAMLPGADVTMTWLPERPRFGGPRVIGQETFSRGALLWSDMHYSKAWPILDAKQQAVQVPRERFVKFLTENGVEDKAPVSGDGVKESVVFVGCGEIGVFIEVEKGAVCRIEAKPDK